MADAAPTRTNLLVRKAQVRLAMQGIDLLKRKREALIKEFLSVAREFVASREGLDSRLHRAFHYLFTVRAVEGEESLRSVEAALEPATAVVLEERRVWGIAVPKVRRSWVRPRLGESDLALPTISARLARAKSEFELVLDDLVDLASTEILLRRLGDEIKRVNRRVNALDQVLVPRLRYEMRAIRGVLEEREREDKLRLKRIKARSGGSAPWAAESGPKLGGGSSFSILSS